MVALITVAVVVAVFIVAVVAVNALQTRMQARAALRRLDTYELPDQRERTMLQPVGDRVIAPIVAAMVRTAHRVLPSDYAGRVARKLVLAGSPPGIDVDRFLVYKVLGAASGVGWLFVVYGVLGLSGPLALLVVVGLSVASFFLPDLWLTNTIHARQHQIRVQLPDVLDLLVISVEAGLGFEQAVERTTVAIPGALADEFRRMLQELRIGSARSQALRAMEERCDVQELRSFVMAMIQADTFGVSIARILRVQADEMRIRRRVGAQEQAQKAPVKMLFPMILCIFPAMFVIVLGPAVVQLSRELL